MQMEIHKSNIKQAKSHLNLQIIETYSKYGKDLNQEDDDYTNDHTRCYSSTDENYSLSLNDNNFISKDQDEEVLIELFKSQRRISNYSQFNTNIAFTSRTMLFTWVEKVISLLNIREKNQASIYYRFTTLYDRLMEILAIDFRVITSEDELKKTIVTIFLIAYKFEGHSIGKITIQCLINSFLRNVNGHNSNQQNRLVNDIRKIEVNILRTIEYNVYMLNTNIHTVSYTLLTLIRSYYSFKDELYYSIEKALPIMNKKMLLSTSTVFELMVIDISAISLSAAFNYVSIGLVKDIEKRIEEDEDYDPYSVQLETKELGKLSDELYDYLNSELKVIKVSYHEYKQLALKFSNELN